MKLKNDTVKLFGIRTELLCGINIVDSVFFKYFNTDIVVTSGTEQTTSHSRTSLHYSGCAVDFRLPDDPLSLNLFLKDCQKSLGSEFDIILESDHIHFEFQPKCPK